VKKFLRHTKESRRRQSHGDTELIDAIDAHVQRHLGPVAEVVHQIDSPWVHVDVHCVEPTEERPWHTFVTSGMSERAMATKNPGLQYAELVLSLPPTWPLREEHWPLSLLQDLAELPHRFETLLGTGHTIPNGDPPQPYAPDTSLCCALIGPALLVPDEFEHLTAAGRDISFLGVIVLTAAEMQLKLDQGLDALFDKLDEAEVSELLLPDRASAVA
jgi:hypothetical protein